MSKMNIDWDNLAFGYTRTPYNVRCYYRDGAWRELEVHSEETINMHMAATCLHYGQEAFEGLKAFDCADGKVRIFRMEENAKRMIRTADYIRMAAPSVELFGEAVKKAVLLNKDFIPPLSSGGSLYIRPLLIGMTGKVGVSPSSEYLFLVFVTPVGSYYKGAAKPISVIIDRDHDRAAPLGTGSIKVGGNYAASFKSLQIGHEKGYDSVLYIDPKEKKYIDECGAANFFGIRDNTYITPESASILPSITNMSLAALAQEMGLKVERRKVGLDELGSLEECGCCGTAAAISPIGTIHDPVLNKTYAYGKEPGKWCAKLYERLTGIQRGQVEDKHGWNTIL